jgi:uncharacterized membrane protein
MTKLVVVIGFLLSFAAGLMLGQMQGRRHSIASATGTTATTRSTHRVGGWLTSELGLSAGQQKEMDRIWSETAGRGRRETEERRRRIRVERDEALASLVRSEDKVKYDQILENYQEEHRKIDVEMRSNFESAVKRTKELLTPEQRTKYDQLLQRHQWDRGSRGGPGRRGGDRPAPQTAPSTTQSTN